MESARSPEFRRGSVARRANYGFEKRQKELKRQKKKDRKAEKKRMKKEAAAGGDQGEVLDGGDGDVGAVDDWLSDPDQKSEDGG
jgi:hypothetical protein